MEPFDWLRVGTRTASTLQRMEISHKLGGPINFSTVQVAAQVCVFTLPGTAPGLQLWRNFPSCLTSPLLQLQICGNGGV